jgi:hypothetical protein
MGTVDEPITPRNDKRFSWIKNPKKTKKSKKKIDSVSEGFNQR